MSQLPPPGYAPRYSFWPVYLTPPDALLAPARHAGTCMLVLGAMIFLIGIVATAGAAQMPEATLNEFIKQAIARGSPDAASMTPTLLRVAMGIMAGVIALVGVMLAGAGAFVRGGSYAGAVVASVAVAIPLAGVALLLVALLMTEPTAAATYLVLVAVPLALMGLTIRLLVDAFRNAPAVAAARRDLAGRREHYRRLYGNGEITAHYEPLPPTPPVSAGPPPIP